MMIPGGTVHQEIATSDTMELLEVSVPARLGTVNCAAPARPGRPLPIVEVGFVLSKRG